MRSGFLDAIRGMAVLWMIIFHTAYDLKNFHLVAWDFSNGFWFAFPRVIAFTFLFCVGISLNYTHKGSIQWKKLTRRCLKIGACAAIISLVTYYAFPTQWIYFGTLHCICVGSFLGALFVNHRKMAGIILMVILVSQYGLGFDIKWVSSILQKHSMDFIPIYPWFWAILSGILIGPYLSKVNQLQAFQAPKVLEVLGKNSLRIYLFHQPLIFGALWLITSIFY